MTDVAVIKPGWGLNVVFLYQLFTERCLIDRGLVAHGEYLIFWTHILLRMAVAIQAPFHIKRVGFPGQCHLVHTSMTGLTTYALGNMNAMVEVNIIRQVVHSIPLDRLTRPETFSDRLEYGTLIPDLAVTSHAGFRRWDISE